MIKTFREQIKHMKEEDYKSFVFAIILEEYEWEGVGLKEAEEIYEIFIEFDDLVKITEIVDAHEIWCIEKMSEGDVYLSNDRYES